MEPQGPEDMAALLLGQVHRLEKVVLRLSVAVILNLVIALLAVWIALRGVV